MFRNNFIVITIILAGLYSGCTKPAYITDWQLYGLKGEVKSVIEKSWLLPDGKSLQEAVPDSVVIYNFSEMGMLQEVVLLDGDNNLLTRTEFKYLDDGRLYKTVDSGRDSKVIRESSVMSWNKDNLPVKARIKVTGSKDELWQITDYNSSKIACVSVVNSEGEEQLKQIFEYDENGNRVGQTSTGTMVSLCGNMKTDSCLLACDNMGNWVKKQTEVAGDNELIIQTERRVVYY